MKATVIDLDLEFGPRPSLRLQSGRATVQLDPHWIARLLGARPQLVELVAAEQWCDGEVRWRAAGTNRDLREMATGSMIREALEVRPIAELPMAIAARGAACTCRGPRIRKGDRVAKINDRRGGWSVVVARYDELAVGTALGDETDRGNVLVATSTYGATPGVWMRVGSR
jgi:hypothetical protein